MNKFLLKSSVLLLPLALMSSGHAQNVGEEVFEVNRYSPVYCDQGHSIQHVLDRALSGSTRGGTVVILVWGTCHESVTIRSDNVNIIGRDADNAVFGDEATIIPPQGTPAIRVENAENVFIGGFNIPGGRSGVEIAHGSSAWIQNNRISGGGIGVQIAQGSSARVIDNQIGESTERGIFISGASYGELSGNVLSNTTIGGSGLSQIFVAGNGAADITNNTINASSGNGIVVVSTSSAVVNDNNLSTPSGVGMLAGSNSSIALLGPNTVSGGVAIVCSASGAVFVGEVQTITAGGVFVNPGCDLNNDVGDPAFPP